VAVDAVAELFALDPARHFEHVVVIELRGRRAVGIVDHNYDFRRIARRPVRGASEDHLVHVLCAHRLGRAFAITKRSASTRLDLPQPLGPTTPVMPVSIWKSDGSTNDLNPIRRRRVNCMFALARPRRESISCQFAWRRRPRQARANACPAAL
jgi:hypothetical protein